MNTAECEEVPAPTYVASGSLSAEVPTAADPFEMKGLAIAYKITPAQVAALLLKYGRNWLQFDRGAAALRRR